jgi:uncharacterized phage protein (TIGR02220 family)
MSRGVTLCHNENIETALDIEISHIEMIKKTMQGRLLDGNRLLGWQKRQPAREDETATERKRRQRAAQQEIEKLKNVTQCHEVSRNVTTDKIRGEKRREEEEDKRSLSGKPDDDIQKSNPDTPKKRELRNQAIEVLNFLNLKTGRKFRTVDINLKLIIARLKSGATIDDCRGVIAKKTREWEKKSEMAEYLRPKTLFSATNFEQYIGEIVPIEENL